MPNELGLWYMAAQTFIRWSRFGVWERLLALVQQQGVQLGMTFLPEFQGFWPVHPEQGSLDPAQRLQRKIELVLAEKHR